MVWGLSDSYESSFYECLASKFYMFENWCLFLDMLGFCYILFWGLVLSIIEGYNLCSTDALDLN